MSKLQNTDAQSPIIISSGALALELKVSSNV